MLKRDEGPRPRCLTVRSLDDDEETAVTGDWRLKVKTLSRKDDAPNERNFSIFITYT